MCTSISFPANFRRAPKVCSPHAVVARCILRFAVADLVFQITQLNRIMMVTNELMEGVDDPWSNMEVRINQRQAGGGAAGMQLQREWTKDEDRYLLCLTHL